MLPSRVPAQKVMIESEREGQRIDNFLFSYFKKIPKSRIYQMLRKGEVRVNGKRISASYRLVADDLLRLPPVTLEAEHSFPELNLNKFQDLKNKIIFEDEKLLILAKPAGISVHKGGGEPWGLVEVLQKLRSDLKYIELAHRIDKETSGCLIFAKKRSALKELHTAFRDGKIKKIYRALVQGRWQASQLISSHLDKDNWRGHERIVKISDEGKLSTTLINPIEFFSEATLIEAQPKTGRMHQIRVHCLQAQHPIAGDAKYGDNIFNKNLLKIGLKRLFLHAYQLEFQLSYMDKALKVQCPLSPELEKVLNQLRK